MTSATTSVKKDYYSGGQRIALRDGNNLRWLVGDHLGSTAYTVNGTSESGEVRYKPYGATRYTTGTTPTTFRYTGQREEATLGLDYYGARWYDPQLGMFLSPDTVVPNATNGMDFNRYLYVNGNPMRYTDPSGHEGFEGVCTYCKEDEGSGAPDRGDGSSFHLSGVDSRALQADAAAETARQANAAKNGGFFNRIGNFFKWLIGSEETEASPKQPNAASAAPKSAALPTPSSAIGSIAKGSLPNDAQTALTDIQSGAPRPNVRNPKVFANDGRGGTARLPSVDTNGNPISYDEYTVNPRPPGGKLDGKRIVIGSDGSIYYTADHFVSWQEVK